MRGENSSQDLSGYSEVNIRTPLNRSPNSILGSRLSRILSLVLIFTLFFSVVSVSVAVTPNASAQSAPSQAVIPVSITYTYNYENRGCADPYPCETTTISTSFSASANITPVEGGYEGTGSGSYEDIYDRVVDPYSQCPDDSFHTTTFGNADMVVHYQFSIDNDVTGGIDDSMYNSSWGIVEVLVEDYDLHTDHTSRICGETQSYSHDDGAVGFGCFFHSLDFTTGGTWTQIIGVTDDSTAKCVLNIGESSERLRIFGTATVPASIYGVKGISNSKVVIAEMVDDDFMKPLSTSKPDFFSETLTSDDETANYEFRFARNDTSKLPRILVVSLLWHVGNPEFAVTNGDEVGESFIPVYQALCVDEDDLRCEKWQRTSDGSYEAEVNFEYGNEGKLSQTMSIMEMEAWKGANSTLQLMRDSAYIYYNTYRGVKFLNTLEPPALDPVMIKTYHQGVNCTAYFDAIAKLSSNFPYFGDLGAFLDKVEATGSGIYYCGSENSLERPHAPINREWHELGHYFMFQLYSNPYVYPQGTPHDGYLNAGTNDSVIEGFAEFIAMATNEYFGEPMPYIYPVGSGKYNLEQDYKVWGPWIEEEFAVAGILWDIHDAGTERIPYNASRYQITSRMMNNTDDVYSLDAKTIISKIDRDEPKTLEALLISLNGGSLGPSSASLDVIRIALNHGAFADISATRNWIHDSWNAEPVGQTGNAPDRLIRSSPAPELPGSNLVSDRDATFNVTIKHIEPFSYYDFSYLVDMKAGEPTFFSVPPDYYPSIVTVTPLSQAGDPLSGTIEINSTDYWNYIRSNPASDQIFKSVTVGGESTSDGITAVQYIQNAKNLLSRASTEYKAGNATGAEMLVNIAYLDNFEHAEAALEQRNATDLKEQVEEILGVELVSLIRDRADSQAVDDKISEVNMMLDQAIVIVPEFPYGMVMVLMVGLIFTVLLARSRGITWLRLW